MKITESQLLDLLKEVARLRCLEAGGVDNWEWYGESLDDEDEMLEALCKGYEVICE